MFVGAGRNERGCSRGDLLGWGVDGDLVIVTFAVGLQRSRFTVFDNVVVDRSMSQRPVI